MAKSKLFDGVGVNKDFDTLKMHEEMQKQRRNGDDVSFKEFLAQNWDEGLTPEKFYQQLGVDLKSMSVEKLLETGSLTRGLFPEIFRDAIIRGLEYSPFYGELITGNEPIESKGITMPTLRFDQEDPDTYRLREVNEGATIPEADVVTWSEKQVTVRKKGRAMKQTYESIMWTPIDLARVYFEELGSRLGADLDAELIDVLINGDQADGSEAAVVMGSTDGTNLVYKDLARAWIRMRRLGRNVVDMIGNDAEMLNILLMEEFQKTRFPGATVDNATGTTINIKTPMPQDANLWLHEDVPDKQLILLDRTRAVAQLTAMPLMVETDKLIQRQVTVEVVSIMTGFANVFSDARIVLDYDDTLVTSPGPSLPS